MGTTPNNPDPNAASTTTAAANPSTPFLDNLVKGNIVRDTTAAVDDPANVRARNMVKELGQQLKANPSFMNNVNSGDMIDAIEERIAEIDAEISLKLNAVMHHPGFQKLEATWRGLNYLVMKSETGDALKVRVLNATMDDLKTDIQKATEFDQSVLFKKVYEEEYGTFGGSRLTSCPRGRLLLRRQALRTWPCLKGSATGVARRGARAVYRRRLAGPVRLAEFHGNEQPPRSRQRLRRYRTPAPWVEFRKSEDSRYVALALPRMLLRLPYDPTNNPVEEFKYEEFFVKRDPQVESQGHRFTFIEDVDSKDPNEVPLGQCRTGAGRAYYQCVLALSLVCRHSRCRRRRSGSRSALPHFHHRRWRRGAQVPHRSRHHGPP